MSTRFAAVLVAMMVLLVPAAALAQTTTASVSLTNAVENVEFDLAGTGWENGSTVAIEVVNDANAGVAVITLSETVDATTGIFTTNVNISSLSAGNYTASVAGTDGGTSAAVTVSATFVVAATTTTTLPNTGPGDAGTMLVLGLVALVAAGGLALVANRS